MPPWGTAHLLTSTSDVSVASDMRKEGGSQSPFSVSFPQAGSPGSGSLSASLRTTLVDPPQSLKGTSCYTGLPSTPPPPRGIRLPAPASGPLPPLRSSRLPSLCLGLSQPASPLLSLPFHSPLPPSMPKGSFLANFGGCLAWGFLTCSFHITHG